MKPKTQFRGGVTGSVICDLSFPPLLEGKYMTKLKHPKDSLSCSWTFCVRQIMALGCGDLLPLNV